MRRSLIIAAAICFGVLPLSKVKAQTYKGTINKVKIYTSQANVEKSVSFPLHEGVNEIKLQMPQGWQEQSIQFLAKGDFIIQEFTPLTEENENNLSAMSTLSAKEQALLKTLKDSLQTIQDSQADDNTLLDILNKQKKSLDNMKAITQSSQMDSIQKIKEGFAFYSAKMLSVVQNIRAINRTVAQRQLVINSLSKRIQALQAGEQPLQKYQKYEVLTIYAKKDIAKANLTYSYNVNGVAWRPYYDVKFSKTSNDVAFVLKAKLRQASGEDWKNVPLCFSTETVNDQGELQALEPYYLYYTKPRPLMRKSMASNRVMLSKAEGIQEEDALDEDMSVMSDDTRITTTFAINSTGYSQYTQTNETLLGKEYSTGLTHNILSGDKDKTITLEEQQTTATYKYFSVPKLENSAYIVAQIADWEKLQLVQAPTKIYIDGDYNGQGEINTDVTKDTLSLSVGKDPRVIIERKVVRSKPEKSSLLSSSIETEVSVTLTVRNNNTKTITLNIEDQVPLSQSQEIKVTTKDLQGAVYDPKTGKLIWEKTLKASQSCQITFSYTVKSPKDSNIILN